MIAIIDYGMGNLRSVQKGFERVGYRAMVTDRPEEVAAARAVVLPGVGAFRDGMENLKQRGLVDPITEAIVQGKPFLGICLGLQLLFTWGEEFGFHRGLDILPGRVARLPDHLGEERLKIPHMGWNTLSLSSNPLSSADSCPLLDGIPPGAYVYFVHSYFAIPQNSDLIAATTCYGLEFPSVLWQGNIFATQFHPEKSQQLGLRILENFGKLSGSLATRTF